jgi:hypothetical protein
MPERRIQRIQSTPSVVEALDLLLHLLARSMIVLVVAMTWNGRAKADDRTTPPPALPDPSTVEGKNPSSIKPPPADDHHFVVNEGAALDGPCRFKAGGDLVIDIPVTRYAGPTDNNGNLADAVALVQNGYLGEYAQLQICAYDVEWSGRQFGIAEEQDRVKFNDFDRLEGEPFATSFLYGQNEKWQIKTFYVPIAKIKFPTAAGAGGNAPTAVVNTVRITLDEKSAAPGKWCTAIDWVALRIQLMSPIALVHGNDEGLEGAGGLIFTAPGTDANNPTRGQNYTSHLDAQKLLWSNDVDLTPEKPLSTNGKKLSAQLPRLAAQFGVDSIHVVAHSKGGLDTRYFLEHFHDPKTLKIVSFATLSTPNDGSVLADILVARKSAAVDEATFIGFPLYADAVAAAATLGVGHFDLQVTSVAAFATTNVPAIRKKLPDIEKGILFSVGADMDTNGNVVVDNTPDEYKEMRDESTTLREKYAETFTIGPSGKERTRRVVNAVYQTLGSVATVTVARGFRPGRVWGGTMWVAITAAATPAFQGNDALVTIRSAHGQAGTGAWRRLPGWALTFAGATAKNHSSVVGPASAGWVTPKQKAAERAIGDLK